MKNYRLLTVVLMFVISLLIIQPLKAATTAMSVTGPGGVRILASTETGFVASTQNFTQGSVIVNFRNPNSGQQMGLFLLNKIFNQPLTPGTYPIDQVFPSPNPNAIQGNLGLSWHTDSRASGTFAITELEKDSFTSLLTKFAGDGMLTVEGVEYEVSVRFNSSFAIPPVQVPEPSTFLLSLIGLAALMRRKR